MGEIGMAECPYPHREVPQSHVALLRHSVKHQLERRAEAVYMGRDRIFEAVRHVKLHHAVRICREFLSWHCRAGEAADGKHVKPHCRSFGTDFALAVASRNLYTHMFPRYLAEGLHHLGHGFGETCECPAYHLRRD